MAPTLTQITSDVPTEHSVESCPVAKSSPLSEGQPDVSQADILAFLSSSAAYGLSEPVDRVDMIQSVMFLAGPFCFKLRRQTPVGHRVHLSLESRYQLALKEMRLGRNFAPDLQYDLVAIRVFDGGLVLKLPDGRGIDARTLDAISEGEAPIVDWLVMTRRYDFSKSFDKQIAIYQPNFSDSHRLAELIVPQHEPDQTSQSAQSWLCHLETMLESFGPLVRQLDKSSKKTTLRACLSRSIEQLDKLRPLIRDRGERGLFGQIHGNVRLSNVVELPDGLRLVNPQVSRNAVSVREWVGDPLFDLASLVGELWSRGLHRQANWVFSHYCNRLLNSDLLDGLRALDLYVFVRAMERANLLAHAISNDGVELDLYEAGDLKNVSLTGYVNTAHDCLLQDEAMLLVVGGSHHATRSRFARLLAPAAGRMPGAVYLSAQEELLALYDVPSGADLPLSARRKSVWNHVYRRLADKARHALSAGYAAVIEGQFDNLGSRQHITALAREVGPGVPVHAFHLYDPHGFELQEAEAERAPDFERDSKEGTLSRSMVFPPQQPDTSMDQPILGVGGCANDWTKWTELDASRPASDLLGLALRHLNPSWTPASRETLH